MSPSVNSIRLAPIHNLSENNTGPYVKVAASTRLGRNGNYSLTNHSPKDIHKARRYEIRVPAINKPYRILTSVYPLNGNPCTGSRIAILSEYENMKNILRPSTIFASEVFDGRGEREIIVFLHTIPTEDPKSKICNSTYRFSLQMQFENNNTFELHQFEFTPKKSHKFESSPSGKKQNETNAESRLISLSAIIPEAHL